MKLKKNLTANLEDLLSTEPTSALRGFKYRGKTGECQPG